MATSVNKNTTVCYMEPLNGSSVGLEQTVHGLSCLKRLAGGVEFTEDWSCC